MANIKVRDLAETLNITTDNKLMVLTNDASNQVKNITVENFIDNINSSDTDNGITIGTDGKLYVDNTDTGVTAGTYAFPQNLEVDSKGRITGIVNGTPASVPIATSSSVGVVKPDNDTIIVDGNGTIACKQNNGYQMFDIVLKDHVLDYEETLGFAQLGSYVYKEAIAGTRYGYPDFYAKCVVEYTGATSSTATISGQTVTIYTATNGHIFYDIADKSAFDDLYTAIGIANYYGLDTINERVFLPRNDYLTKYVANGTHPVRGNGISLGMTTGSMDLGLAGSAYANANYLLGTLKNYGETVGSTVGTLPTYGNKSMGITTDAEKSGIVADITNTSNGLIAYMVVGNQSTWAGMTDIVNQGMSILEQVNEGLATRVNIDGSNAIFPYIKDTYENGSSGYIVYSNGYCEQWGYNPPSPTNYLIETVTLLKTYKDTNYQIIKIFGGTTNTTAANDAVIGGWLNKYAGSFTTYNFLATYFNGYTWRTLGYLAEGEY